MTWPTSDEARVLARIEARSAAALEEIRSAIRQPSISQTGEGIPAMADWVQSYLEALGARERQVPGQRAPIVGAVSMDMITVDVTNLGDVQPGDEVVILGRQGRESWQHIDAREVAAAIGTIPWEIVCRLGTRIERQYD